MKRATSSRGFTLIELMIVVAIVGIIAAVAYPSYVQYVLRSKRDECAGQMTKMASALERYYSTTGRYTGFAAVGWRCPADSGAQTYALDPAANGNLTNIQAQFFTITAVPQGSQASDKCGNLTLTDTGLKGAKGVTTPAVVQECWR